MILATALAYGASCSASDPGAAVAAVPDAVAPDVASSPWSVSLETAPVPMVEQDEPGLERHLDPAVAVGSSIVLVAWSDERSDPLNQFGGDIMLARYAADGTALDPKGIRLAVTADEECSPRIAFGKELFLVTWWAITRAPNGAGGDGLVRAARVAPDGSVLDPQGLDLGKNAGPPEVAFVDDRFLVTFEANDSSQPGGLRVVSVTSAGAVQSEPTVVAPEHAYSPQLAGGPATALLSYVLEPSVTNRSIHLRLLDADAKTLKEHAWPVAVGFPSLVAGGAGGFIAMTAQSMSMPPGISTDVRRLDANGDWLDPAPIKVAHLFSRIARDGTGYLLLGDAAVFRLEDGSSVPGPSVAIPDPSGVRWGDVASDGATRAAAWADTAEREVSHARLAPTGATLDATPKRVPRARTAQVAPSLVQLGGTPLLTWCEASLAGKSVRYAWLDSTATAASGPVLSIPDACRPVAAAGESAALVVWERVDASAIDAALVTPGSGASPSISIAKGWTYSDLVTTVERPHVAATQDGFVVVHAKTEYEGFPHPSLQAVSLDSTGSVTGSAALGQWWEAVPVAVGADVVLAVRAWDPIIKSPLQVGPLSGELTEIGELAPEQIPAIAADGQRALVVWTDHTTRRVWGAFISSAGQLIGQSFAISPPTHDALDPAVAHDGSQFVVMWRDLRTREVDLHATRVSSSGALLDTEGAAISLEAGNELAPSIAGGDGRLVIAYPRFDPELDRLRVLTRTVPKGGMP